MKPHHFEHEGGHYEASFEQTAEGWIGRIRREGSETVHVVAFPKPAGFDPDDVRGSLIAGCEAVVSQLPVAAPTRH